MHHCHHRTPSHNSSYSYCCQPSMNSSSQKTQQVGHSLSHSMRARARTVFGEMTCLAETGRKAIAAVACGRDGGSRTGPLTWGGGRRLCCCRAGRRRLRRAASVAALTDGERPPCCPHRRRVPSSIAAPNQPPSPPDPPLRPPDSQPTAEPDSLILPPPLLSPESPEPARHHALARGPSHVETMPSSGRGTPAPRAGRPPPVRGDFIHSDDPHFAPYVAVG
jgi:hypothetical protein